MRACDIPMEAYSTRERPWRCVAADQLKWILLISRQGKVRLSKWYGTLSQKNKNKIVKDVTQLVLARRVRCC